MEPSGLNHAAKVARTAAVGLALFHLGVLAWLLVRRAAYPYDLEWMEGGMLCHALRLLAGQPIYAAPSIDFIPFLYTPLYPALLALLGKAFGVGYLVARLVSIAAMAGALFLGYRFCAREGGSRAAALSAMAGFAAAFFLTGAFYDLARPDSLWLSLCAAAALALYRGARDRDGQRRRFREAGAHAWVAAAALLLVLAFFTKQTAGPIMAGLGLSLCALNPVLVPTFGATLAAAGLPALSLLNRHSGGWFWRYVFELHQGHDFFAHRAFVETPLALAAIVGPALLLCPWALAMRRTPAVLYAAWLLLVGAATAATASGTQWAITNAYIPGVYFAAVAGGVCAGQLLSGRRRAAPRWRPALVFTLLAASLALKLPALDGRKDDAFLNLSRARLLHRFDPRRFIPTAEDKAAGDALIARLRATPGDVLVPFHPFYARLAGKPTFVHQMGVMDVGRAGLGVPAGLAEAFGGRRFSLVVVDDKIADKWPFWPGLQRNYQLLETIRGPKVVSGAQTAPQQLLTPRPHLP